MAEHAPTAESVTPTDEALNQLSARFGDAIQPDTREGFSGLIVQPDQLIAVATALRDDLGYDYLASATAVDYLGKGDHFEMVYHLCRTKGGPPLVVKAQTPRDVAALPSLVPVWPGAEFQEREAWDLMGIHFDGHPDLRRILMWDGYPGWPLRKDFPLAGVETPLPDPEIYEETSTPVIPAPMMGGPFVASPGEINLTEAEPRAKDESWNERVEKPKN